MLLMELELGRRVVVPIFPTCLMICLVIFLAVLLDHVDKVRHDNVFWQFS
jgi:uncharacterized membrane protein